MKLTDKQLADAKFFFPEGSTVYCILRSRSRSGMSREIGLVIFKDGAEFGQLDRVVYHPNHLASELSGERVNKAGEGLVVRGCGMDMGFHLVSNLAIVIYGRSDALRHVWL
jgi:hypothetical protein